MNILAIRRDLKNMIPDFTVGFETFKNQTADVDKLPKLILQSQFYAWTIDIRPSSSVYENKTCYKQLFTVFIKHYFC